ncbi:MAG TPA: amidohydrolase family protein [Anaerolineales bacterium]|nr:amidohydrolase family protein [Anaerolineales bacterium]
MKRAILSIVLLLSACTPSDAGMPTQQPSPTQPTSPTATPAPTSSQEEAADVIFHGGVVLIMDERLSAGQALAVKGDKIIAVGTDDDVMALAGPQTQMIALDGRTLMPGFVDAHTHILNDAAHYGMDLDGLQQLALENGITTLANLFTTQDFLNEMRDYNAENKLRVRTSLYLIYNNNCGDVIGNWWKDVPPTREPGEMLRVGGVKVFSDGGSCNRPALSYETSPGSGLGDLFLTSDQIAEVVGEAQSVGHQVAIHALGDRAIEAALDGLESAMDGGPNEYRHRIDHNAILRPDLLPRYGELDIVATIFGTFPSCIDFANPSPPPYNEWEWAWDTLLEANPGLHVAWHGDDPYIAPLSPILELYGLVTRNYADDDRVTVCEAKDWIADNTLTVEQALPMMNRESAYALWRDGEVGTLETGKFADLIILSHNPMSEDPDILLDTYVLMTMVGGAVEWCAPGSESLCPSNETSAAPSTGSGGDRIFFYNGQIITMEDAQPQAEAVLIQGDTILAVGSEADILSLADSQTIKIDLEGKTLVPGFIDSHVHRIGDRGFAGIDSAEASIQLALEQGYTSMNEMFVNQERLDELRSLDEVGSLRLRVNAYLPLNYDEPKFGLWYQDYQPGFAYSPYLRLGGLKIFMDHGWGKGDLLWTQAELDQTLTEATDLGWQIAAHSVGEPAHTMLLNTIERIQQTDPGRDHRFRIEHVIVISDEDVQRMADLNVLASVQLHAPNTWSTDFDDFYPEVDAELQSHFTRYRDLTEAGVRIIGSSDWPYAALEEGFGSPMKLLYQAVTRVGTGGHLPEDWMIGQEIPIELAMRSLTINGAYGTFEEDIKGSLKPGKLGDLVILSANPLDTPIENVPDIEVLMTMIGGKVEWCAPGSESLCPTTPELITDGDSIPFGHLDSPAPDETISGTFTVAGWALVDGGPIDRIEIYLDGENIGDAVYGDPRPDVAADYPGREGEPNFGYSFQLDTTQYGNGPHTLSAVAFSLSGDQGYLIPETLSFVIEN